MPSFVSRGDDGRPSVSVTPDLGKVKRIRFGPRLQNPTYRRRFISPPIRAHRQIQSSFLHRGLLAARRFPFSANPARFFSFSEADLIIQFKWHKKITL